MSDTSISDGGDPGAAPTGGGTVLNGTGGDGGETPTFDFGAAMQALPDDIRGSADLQRIASFEDLAKGFVHAKSMVGADRVVIPGEDATDEQVAEFYGKLGMPESAEAYHLERPENAPEGFEYSEDTANNFKQWAHEAKLTQSQAQVIHDKFFAGIAEAVEQQNVADAEAVTNADREIRGKWGGEYDRNLALAGRAIDVLGGEVLVESLKKAGMLTGDGEVKDPTIAFAFAEAGKLMGEDMMVHTGTGSELPGAAQAKAELAKLNADPEHLKAWQDESHPGHQMAIDTRTRLQKLAHSAAG